MKRPIIILFLSVFLMSSQTLFSASLEEADRLLQEAQSAKSSQKEKLFEAAGKMYLELAKNKKIPKHIVHERIGEYFFFKYQLSGEKRDVDKAKAALLKATRRKNDYALAYAKLGEISAVVDLDFDMSRYYYEQAVSNEDSEPQIINRIFFRIGLAFSYSRRNYFKNAFDIYKDTLTKYPTEDVRLYLNIADVLRRWGGAKSAKHSPTYYKKALTFLNQSLKKRPENLQDYLGYVYHDIGLNLILLEKYAEAESYFNQALKVQKNYALAYYHLGVALYRQYQADRPKNDREKIPEHSLAKLKAAQEAMQTAYGIDKDLTDAKNSLIVLSPAYQRELEKWKKKTITEIKKEVESEDIYSAAVLTKLRSALLDRINEDRRKFGLKSVKTDSIAERIGQINALEQQKNQFVGHQSLDGSNPYYRYSQAGGADYHAQNTAGRWGYKLEKLGYEQALSWILDSHYRMVSEIPPHDGHRRNILDPYRNYVGIGLAYSEKDCYVTQEFLNRYLVFSDQIPKTMKVSEKFEINARPLSGFQFAGATLFFEPAFKRLSAAQINAIPNYSLPATRLDLYKKLPAGYKYANGSRGDVEIDNSGRFTVPFKPYKNKGVYTLIIWLTDKENGKTIPGSTISVLVK